MKKINFKKIFSIKNTAFSLFIFVAIFLFSHFALAESPVAGALGNVVGVVISFFIRAISSILILLVNVLMNVAAYSDFIKADAVSKGWVVVRDLCNMFFVVVLLVIAFATILGQEEYGAKKMLPKLIMAAVLINFSKLICGLMIDLSNVVMLTFVNAFSAIGAGNILDMLGISEVTQIAIGDDKAAVTFGVVVSAYIFGLIYVTIATVVIAAMLGMLIVRVVMIWILVVLSPFAFFLQAVPGAGKYSSQWWNKWTSNLLVGPIIAFFLWLSFAALQGGNPIAVSESGDTELKTNNTGMDTIADGAIGSKAGTTSAMAKFAIAIGMLLAGMKIAQEVGGEAGGAMGKIFSKGKGMATAAGIGALAATGKAAGRGALWGTGKLVNAGSQIKAYQAGDADWKKKGNAVGNFALGWQADLVSSNKKAKKEAAAKYLKKMGIGEKGSETGQTLIDTPGFQKASNFVKGATIGGLTGGFGIAGTAITAAAGATIGGGAGYFGARKRQQIKEEVKKYKSDDSSVDKAKVELAEHDGHQKNVDEFDQKKKRASDLLNSKWQNGGTFLNKKDEDEYNESDAFVKDKDNLKRYSNSSTYLSTSNRADKEKNLTDAEAVVAGNKDKYDKAKKWQKRTNFLDTFKNTKAAMSDNTKEKEAAQKRVEAQANNPDYWLDKNASRYPSTGLRKSDKKELEILNAGGGKADDAIKNLMAAIPAMPDKVAEQWAFSLAALEKDNVKLDPKTLGSFKTELAKKVASGNKKNGNAYEFNADSLKEKAMLGYKRLGSSVEDVKDGSGALEYDAFAKNSAKTPTDRNARKDVMGVSFAKLNEKAEAMGVDYKLDVAEGVHQKVDGAQLTKLSTVMSGLIDEEIAALQKAGGDINNQKISQLNTAKTRLQSGDVSGLSLKNSDVVYKGETDSERRRNEYNTTQHETMHQYGAKDEVAVDNAASALQEAKLVGRIPKSDVESGGKSYDEVLGSMIAKMEQSGASQEAINESILSKVNSWSPSNAQRIVETEKGERDTVKDIVKETKSVDTEKIEAAINKWTESLDKPLKSSRGGDSKGELNLSISSVNFFRRMFGGLKNIIKKDDAVISDKLKPLSALAASEETNYKQAA